MMFERSAPSGIDSALHVLDPQSMLPPFVERPSCEKCGHAPCAFHYRAVPLEHHACTCPRCGFSWRMQIRADL